MLEKLKRQVHEANLRIVREGLVLLNWGNVSAVDRKEGVLVIKPSGMAYELMTADTMVPVSLKNGKVLEGGLRPSSDTATHRLLYQRFPAIKAIVHTHSLYATAWAQAGVEIPVLGTTHADCFEGPVPVTRPMLKREIREHYERHTGLVIVERFREIDPMRIPAVLVRGHGPFVWGASIEAAVEHAVVLERVAWMASISLAANPSASPIEGFLLERHFSRKHGPSAYYGQRRT
jgi:L-ribulose-5-phosphate 4-epimerase